MSHVSETDLPELMNNVVLSGGTTLTAGFQERVLWELKNSVHEQTRVIAKPERKYLSWIGASIVSTLATFKDSWLTAGAVLCCAALCCLDCFDLCPLMTPVAKSQISLLITFKLCNQLGSLLAIDWLVADRRVHGSR